MFSLCFFFHIAAHFFSWSPTSCSRCWECIPLLLLPTHLSVECTCTVTRKHVPLILDVQDAALQPAHSSMSHAQYASTGTEQYTMHHTDLGAGLTQPTTQYTDQVLGSVGVPQRLQRITPHTGAAPDRVGLAQPMVMHTGHAIPVSTAQSMEPSTRHTLGVSAPCPVGLHAVPATPRLRRGAPPAARGFVRVNTAEYRRTLERTFEKELLAKLASIVPVPPRSQRKVRSPRGTQP